MFDVNFMRNLTPIIEICFSKKELESFTNSFYRSFIRSSKPGNLRLSNHTNAKHPYLSSFCKSFVRLGLHNG